MKKFFIVVTLLTALFTQKKATAQINLTTQNGSFSENFDTMSATGTALPPGWAAVRYAGSSTIGQALTPAVTDGGANSGGIYNTGTTGAADRALGTLGSGSTVPVFGASFTNNTGAVIGTLSITAFTEQWRTATNSAVNETVVFEYSTNATSLTTGTWTAVTSLNLVEILTASTASAVVDGNLPANRMAISGTIAAVNVNNGSTVWIRWRDNDDSGSDGLYALDDFKLLWTNSATAKNLNIAAGANAAEPATNGTFVIALTDPAPAGGVTVNYTLSGSATAGADYSDPQNGTLTIPQGGTTGTIALNVIDDNISEPTETITATVTAVNNGFSIATATATINLTDNESASAYAFDFSACTAALSDGFTQQSVSGAQVWACTGFGRSGNAVQMNGFATTSQVNEDWLISPALNLSATTVPLLSFYSRSAFAGDALKLYVTANFTGDVTTTTWTELNGVFPASGSDVWTLSENINLSAFKQAAVRFAFRYTSTASAASRWTIDDISIINSTVPPPPSLTLNNTLIDFRQSAAGDLILGKSFTFTGNNMTAPLVITAPDRFLLSKNGLSYSRTLTYSVAELATGQKTVRIGYNPSTTNTTNSGLLSFTSTGINIQRILLKGNTYPQTATLNVVNWNLEWFGGAQGPVDNDLQAVNVKKAMDYINADVYALVEIVDTARLGALVRSLDGGYAYVVSNYGSNASSPSDPGYASAQKLALVYKTSLVSNVSARGLLKSSASANSSWASGRVPFLVNAQVTKNNISKNIAFIVVHGKAGDTQSDYQSRKAGAAELKDTLNAYFSTRNILMLGDFNDDLDKSIYVGSGSVVSSYDDIIKDSVDADSYTSLTLLLSQYGLNSTTDFSDVIDHVVISNEMRPSYLPLSASLLNDLMDFTDITDYGTTTTDHYPVLTRYLLTAADGGPLPVRFIQLGATKQVGAVKLSWTTGQETNTKEFVVERSTDGVNYKSLGSVAARGNSAAPTDYGYTDAQPAAGTNFYRLKPVDNDNRFEYSNIVKINFAKAFTVWLSPNPANDYVTVNLSGTQQPVSLQLVNAGGKVMKSVIVRNGLNRVALDGLSKGLYVARFTGLNDSYTEKLIIQ